jgi:hypothetical protein
MKGAAPGERTVGAVAVVKMIVGKKPMHSRVGGLRPTVALFHRRGAYLPRIQSHQSSITFFTSAA